MLADPDLLMMLPQELLADRVTIFGNDADQSIDIFRMVANQFGQFCHLAFKMLYPPERIGTAVHGRLLRCLCFTRDVTSTSRFILAPLLEYSPIFLHYLA